jgi:hypothetical protein
MKKKILDARYWWPILYKDVNDYWRSCDACQITECLASKSLAKLVTSLPKEPFMKGYLILWGQLNQQVDIQETNTLL